MADRSDPIAGALPALLDGLDTGVILLDAAGRIRLWNAWMEHASGYAATALAGRTLPDAFPALDGGRVMAAVEDALATGAPAVLSHTLNRFPFRLTRPNGEPMIHAVTVRRVLSPAGGTGGDADARFCLLQVSDVTLQVQRERFLRERREARYRAVVDTAQDAIVTTDVAGTVQWLNRAAERQFGYGADEAVGLPIGAVLGQGAALWLEPTSGGVEYAGPYDVRGRRKDGSPVELEMSVSRWTAEGSGTFVTGILRDVSERRREQAELRRAVEQKSLLLREVNHRVKNSLHLVSSLLSLQLRGIADETPRGHFRDAISRIHAIAQVHARLYQTERFESVELGTYLRALVDDILASAGAGVSCTLAVDDETMELPIDQAIPLSLVTNELITNAIKHSAEGAVRIKVSLHRVGEALEFIVRDNGPGLPAGFAPDRARSLGLRIITTLTRQIGGTLHLDPVSPGAAFRIVLPLVEATVEPLP